MLRIGDKATLGKCLKDWRRQGHSLALVPTMGNLHDGHLALVRHATMRADKTIVSIFVNPTQFGDGEDFDSYPRTMDTDIAHLTTVGADLLFTPDVDEIYPSDSARETRITVPGLAMTLCGEFRPGHFSGVATIVNKLLNIVTPDIAVFGEKDYQQLVIIKKMVADLCLSTTIVGVETVREKSGLALSSRNHYLTPAEKKIAPTLYRTLAAVADKIEHGNEHYQQLEVDAAADLNGKGFRTDYVAIRNAHDLQRPAGARNLVVLAAAWLGVARLIDNVPIKH